MLRDAQLYIDDMRQACRKVLRYTRGLDLSALQTDERTYDAVVRNLEVLGEAAKHVPAEICRQSPEVEWKKIAGLRDILTHVYFGIDDAILWDIVTNKIEPLLGALEKLADDQP